MSETMLQVHGVQDIDIFALESSIINYAVIIDLHI